MMMPNYRITKYFKEDGELNPLQKMMNIKSNLILYLKETNKLISIFFASTKILFHPIYLYGTSCWSIFPEIW